MRRRVRLAAAVAVCACALGGCADWVGDDLQSGEAALIEGPDEVVAPSSTSSTVPPEPIGVRALAVGSCADDVAGVDGEMPTDLAAVSAGGPVVPRSCDEEHRYELFTTVTLGAPEAGWPGPEQIDEDALRACTDAFEQFVGVAWNESSLDIASLIPDEAAWAAGDRQGWCVLFDLGLEPIEGSAAGSGR